IQPAARPGFFGNMATDQSRATQSIEGFRVGTRLAVENAAHDFSQCAIPYQQHENSAQVIPVKCFIARSLLLERIKGELAPRQFIQSPPHQVRVAAYQPIEPYRL